MLKRLRTITLLLILSITLIGCGTTDNQNENETKDLTIYTTIYPIQYITEIIAGDIAHIQSVYPTGVDAHTYEPTSKEMTDMAHGDALIYLGAGMESFVDTIQNALQSQDIRFVELGENEDLFTSSNASDPHHEDHDGHQHGDVDPHIWLDPLRMITMGEMILNTLIELDPSHEDQFHAHFNAFKEDMLTLDQAYTDTLQDKKQKDILVAHAAYGYWEERYGIEQIAIRGLTAESEPSQKELTNIVDIAKERNLHYIIFEQNGSDRVVQIIQDYLDAEALYIHNLEVLTEDDIKTNEDYISLMQKNLQVLDQATNE